MYKFPLTMERKGVFAVKKLQWTLKDPDKKMALRATMPISAGTSGSTAFHQSEDDSLPVGEATWVAGSEILISDEKKQPLGQVKVIGSMGFGKLPDFEVQDPSGKKLGTFVIGKKWILIISAILGAIVGGILPALLRSKYFRPTVTYMVGDKKVFHMEYAASLFSGECRLVKDAEFDSPEHERLAVYTTASIGAWLL